MRKFISFAHVPVVICGALLGLAAASAEADTVMPISLNGGLTAAATWSDTASGQTPTAVMGTGSSGPGGVIINDVSGNIQPSTYTFGRAISAPNGSFNGFQISDSSVGQGPEAIGFLDSYVITVPTSIADTSVFSLHLSSSLGLSDLTLRLYDYSTTNGYQVNTTGAVSSAQLVDNWSLSNSATPQDGQIAWSSINIGTLAAGTYVLEAGGLETGSTSGTYQGQFNVQPVPLPAALPLLLSGGLLGGLFARRRRS